MKITELKEYTNPRLDAIVNMIKNIEDHYSNELNKELTLKLNPDQTSSMNDNEALETTKAATISMVGSHYGTNNAEDIAEFINSLISSLPNNKLK